MVCGFAEPHARFDFRTISEADGLIEAISEADELIGAVKSIDTNRARLRGTNQFTMTFANSADRTRARNYEDRNEIYQDRSTTRSFELVLVLAV